MKKDAKHRPITLELIELLKDEKLKEMMDDSIALARKANPNTDSNPIFQTEDLFSFIDRLDGCMPWLICPSKEYSSLYMRLDQGMGFMYFFFDQPLKQLEDKGYFHNSLIYHEPIAGWFRKLVKQMGLFLDSEASWNEEYYQIALANEEFGLKEDLYEDKENWKSFNDFFVRRFRHPSRRLIGSPNDPAVIVSPADASCQGLWRIDENGIVELKGDESQNGIAIKTGTLRDIAVFLAPSSYKDCFHGGFLTHTFLDINNYHRYHFPVSGAIKEVLRIDGAIAPGGVITWDEERKRYYEYFSELFGWQSLESRGLIIMEMDAGGLLAISPIGMCQVASVNFEEEVKVGCHVKKGDPMGYFKYGGSDIVMIFQKDSDFTLSVKENTFLKVGEEYGKVKKA